MPEFSGLSQAEAARRLAAEGANELPSRAKRHVLILIAELVREPMILLLIACGGLYLLLGDAGEAWLLLGSIGVIAGIELYQEQKTERALEALRDLSSPRALVLRDGARVRVPGREVVRGDAVVLVEGDRVPADGLLRACDNLLVDESLLTGESLPVRKAASAEARALDRPGGEELPSVFAGTLIVGGEGLAEVLMTGQRSALGAIGTSLSAILPERTRVQRETARLVRILGIAGISTCALVVVFYGLTRGDWLHGFLAGLTLAISMIPEELPVVLTVFLALGAWRLSRRQVLTRRIPAVEMLGEATVLCADKTGTLTLNQMSVQAAAPRGGEAVRVTGDAALPEAAQELIAASIAASQPRPFDPTEQALVRWRDRLRPELGPAGWTMIKAYPFTRASMAVAYAWRAPDGRAVVAMKGAPEAVAARCRLSDDERRRVSSRIGEFASQALRVLGVARAVAPADRLSDALDDLAFEWLGLVGLADPVRPSAPSAVRECRQAGVRVIMITGDYPATAQEIARQIGLEPADAVLTGPELDRMDDRELARRIGSVAVFARIVPEQKLRLVNALKTGGEVVAMTGDGVNDAPALKAAHIGIAMGGRGTDVAREAAALVLLDDQFSSIVDAIRMGRRIFDNLKKAVAYIFAVHVPIAGLSLIPVMLGWPLVLLPAHIVLMELIIDPACSVIFEAEPEEADVMRRPPRDARAPMFDRRLIRLSLLQGAGVLATVLAVFMVARTRGASADEARALTVTSLVIGNMALIFTNRSWSRTILETLRQPNRALWWIVGGALAVLGAVLYTPGLRRLFRFEALHADDLLICLAAGSLGIVWFELLKWRARRGR